MDSNEYFYTDKLANDPMKIVLADDHRLFREGLRAILQTVPGYQVIAEFGCVKGLNEQLETLSPDLIVLDYRMPGGGTLSALANIKKAYPQIKVVLLTGVDVSALFQQFVNLKADGVLIKDISSAEMLASIRRVLAGQRVLAERVRTQLKSGHSQLTAREFQIMELILEGLNSSAIADRLHLTVKTVTNHRFNLMQKLELKNTIELMHYAIDHGLIETE